MTELCAEPSMRNIKVTILSENVAGLGVGLTAEHGFSAFIEVGEHRILFDTGQGHVLLNNAVRLGVKLDDIDTMVISHGHWDHTGALHDVLALHKTNLPVYVHPDVFIDRYYARKEQLFYAGIPYKKESLEKLGANFEYNTKPRKIDRNVWLTGEIPRENDFEKCAPQLRVRDGDTTIVDCVKDEQSLFIEGEDGLVIIMGCAHPGMINIIRYAMTLTGNTNVQAVIGGTHLMFQSESQLTSSLSALRDIEPRLIGTAHCTGSIANARIMAEFPSSFRQCNVGTVLHLK